MKRAALESAITILKIIILGIVMAEKKAISQSHKITIVLCYLELRFLCDFCYMISLKIML